MVIFAEKQNELSNCMLLQAIKCGSEKGVLRAILEGADVNCTDEGGGTALYHAVLSNNCRIIEALLDSWRCNVSFFLTVDSYFTS